MTDPFGTADRRRAVLASWAGVATRFREDANAEEELVRGGLGGYADRLVVELAQNASDAATRVGVPGVLRFAFADDVLSVANTGAPLDPAGVDGLTSLRASAKRVDANAVGRFGVGFAAVLAVSDEPEVRSRNGGVRFSAERTRAEVAALGGPAAKEASRRRGAVPVLRLVWPVDAGPVPGFDTEVRLAVRPAEVERVRELLAEVDATLLFAFPGLSRIELVVNGVERILERRAGNELVEDGRVTHWLVATAQGVVPAELLAQRPLEEQVALARFTALAAVPLGPDGLPVPLPDGQVLHAPTPTDEPLSLRLHLAASFPLEVSRRRVAPGELTDWLAGRAAEAVVALLGMAPPVAALMALVPRPGLGHAPLDAAICSDVLAGLRATPFLPAAPPFVPVGPFLPVGTVPEPDLSLAGEPGVPPSRLRPGAAVTFVPELSAVAEPLVAALAGVVPGLLPDEWADRRVAPALDALGVRRLDVAGVVDAVTGLHRPPAWWRRLYAALSTAPDLDALASLPVPLTDGRTVTGVRGTLLPGADLAALKAETLAPLGLRVVHLDAVDEDFLLRLGARPATVATILADDRVRGAVADSVDTEDPEPLAEAILALVAAAGTRPGEQAWLAELALPTEDDWYPAGELVVPDSPLVRVFAGMGGQDAPFGVVEAGFATDVLATYGPDVLAVVGCLTTFTVLEADDVDVVDLVDLDSEDADLDLDALAEWAEAVIDTIDPTGTVGAPPGTRIERFRAVRDLDLVEAGQWPAALELLATGAPREVLATAAYALLPDGRRIEVPAYTRWWLAREPILDGRQPGDLRTPDAADLEGLYDLAPTDVDPALLALLGCRTGLLDAIAADPTGLLTRLADPDRTAVPWIVPLVYARIAEALAGARVPAPVRVRIAPDAVAESDQVAVLDQPWRLGALDGRVPVLGGDDPVSVAELLDAPLLSEL